MKTKESLYLPQQEELTTTSPKDRAGGWPAIVSSFSQLRKRSALKRGLKASFDMNQKGGFDCPGCAWPDPDDERATTEYCENGIKALAEEAMDRQIGEVFFRENSIEFLQSQSDFWLGEQGRISHPMIKPKGGSHFLPISWERAFEMAGQKLKGLSSPNEAIFYTSGRTSNEAAFLYQLFVRMFGTNNLPDCSNMCHESSGVGLGESIGIGKGTVTLKDFERCDLIVVMGQNPGTNHPRMLSTLQAAVRRGAKVITINPLKEAGSLSFSHPQEIKGMLGEKTSLTHLFLQLKINSDVALLKGLQKKLYEREQKEPGSILDWDFVENKTAGFEEFKLSLERTSWNEVLQETGLEESEILDAVELIANSKKTIFCWAMGLTQHKNAVANIQEIVNVLLMRGQIGIEGAGVCPVRGHSNVQGDRTVGIIERPKPEFLLALQEEFDFAPPQEAGYNVVEAIDSMLNKPGQIFMAMGGNLLSAAPDTDRTAQALNNCLFSVHVSTKLNRTHLYGGDEVLILPCLSRSEEDIQAGEPQKVSVENSMGIVHSSEGKLKPMSPHLKSEVAIVVGLAEKTLDLNWSMYREDYSNIRDKIEAVIPGFYNYNERFKEPQGFYLPNGVRDSQSFHTFNEKANFVAHKIEPLGVKPDQLIMMTIRTHDQFNTTIYGLDDRYRGIYSGRRVILMNSLDMQDRQLSYGQSIKINSFFNNEKRSVEAFKVIPYNIPKGCVATYFPEANNLVPLENFADKSHTPVSKSVIVTVEKGNK